jgi:dihydroflavonol-4-reductase
MIFVTGGTGMVGSHLLFDLTSRGEKVRALKRSESQIQRTEKIFSCYSSEYLSLLKNIEWVDGDILDKDRLRQLLNGVDQIYHAAAVISFDPGERDEMIHTNCQGTANLVDLALSMNINQFCHVSSIAAIGSPPEGIEAGEDHPWRNNSDHSAYSESKYLSEMEVWRAILEGLDAVIVNPSIIIGPGNWKSGSSALFATIWKGMKFYTKGVTGFVDVRDVTKAMVHLMDKGAWNTTRNQRYILNSQNISYRNLFDQIAVSLHVKRPIFFAGAILLKLAWRFSAIKSFLTGVAPSITRETAKSANKISYYDGSKICRTIGFEYTPMANSIYHASELFLKDFSLK